MDRFCFVITQRLYGTLRCLTEGYEALAKSSFQDVCALGDQRAVQMLLTTPWPLVSVNAVDVSCSLQLRTLVLLCAFYLKSIT